MLGDNHSYNPGAWKLRGETSGGPRSKSLLHPLGQSHHPPDSHLLLEAEKEPSGMALKEDQSFWQNRFGLACHQLTWGKLFAPESPTSSSVCAQEKIAGG